MTLHVSAHIQCKIKVRDAVCLCVIVFLSLSLTMGDPGPCRHSITRDHLLIIRRLIDNQLQSGCSITYTFIERRSLSKCCYVKAALPWILELLTSHFRYTQGSDNHSYVMSLTCLIHNIYSQRCVPQINEELEDDPVSFGMSFSSSPSEALGRVQDVLSEYWELVTTSDSPVDWSCEREYRDTEEPPTVLPTAFSLTTVSSFWDSEKAPQTGLDGAQVGDLKFDFMVIMPSVCGGMMFIFTLYCLVKHKMFHSTYHHTSQVYQNSSLHTDIQDIEMQVQ
ncbi:macrophage colony-stimulating factor 1-like [Oncorhynchus clarkii lewisi]|uniref:macrophage colony-stimulating factor 1-like n=1 Tax=Oncorhynchus clarkii lewisi TaxID=490388 RepID=UPI0039B990D2